MYFPRNWEFGSALSKLRNFVGGFETANPLLRYAIGCHEIVEIEICIWEKRGSKLSRDTDFPEVFLHFPRSAQANTIAVRYIGSLVMISPFTNHPKLHIPRYRQRR
jgi:hypothetical protein